MNADREERKEAVRGTRPAIAVVISFLDSINRGDVAALGELMTEDTPTERLALGLDAV